MAKIEKERVGVYLQTALTVLQENGGQLASRDVMNETEKRLKFTDYEKERFEKTGYIRWQSVIHFFSIDLVKAGWLLKKKGVWYITPEGSQALKMSAKDFINLATKKYDEWKRNHPRMKPEPEASPEAPEEQYVPAYDEAVDSAREEIRDYINGMDPYTFQELIAALLRGMGYHTPFVAPKGRSDGGVDILAYKDPFGTEAPRIKVQVKHKEEKTTSKEIQQLSGALNKDGDTGLFVSSSGFTQECRRRNQKRTAPY